MVKRVNLEIVFQHLSLEDKARELRILQTRNRLYSEQRPELRKTEQEYLAPLVRLGQWLRGNPGYPVMCPLDDLRVVVHR